MGENLDVPGRLAVRTPMQWPREPNGGFSTAHKRHLARPLPDGLFSPEGSTSRTSDRPRVVLVVHGNLIWRYRQNPQIGWSKAEILKHPHTSVLAHVCRTDREWAMVGLHNFGEAGCIVPLALEDLPQGARFVELLGPPCELVPDRQGRIDEWRGRVVAWVLVALVAILALEMLVLANVSKAPDVWLCRLGRRVRLPATIRRGTHDIWNRPPRERQNRPGAPCRGGSRCDLSRTDFHPNPSREGSWPPTVRRTTMGQKTGLTKDSDPDRQARSRSRARLGRFSPAWAQTSEVLGGRRGLSR